MSSFVAVAVAGMAGVVQVGGGWKERELARFVPGLDPVLIRHLVRDDENRWVEWCRSVGTGPLRVATAQLGDALRTPDYRAFLDRRAPLEAANLRITRAQRIAFDQPADEAHALRDISLSPARDFETRHMERVYIALAENTHMLPARKIVLADSIANRFIESGDPHRALYALALAARWELDLGHRVRSIARLENLAAMARTLRESYMLCQFLGQLGVAHEATGRADSTRACFDEGLELARRHGYIDQEVRLLKFYAKWYSAQGRQAAAVDRLTDAIRLCEQPGGAVARPRLQIEYARFFADLECWDLVERSLRRMPPLLRAMPETERESDRAQYSFDAGLLQARLDFVEGRTERGDRRMRELIGVVPAANRRTSLGELFEAWSLGLEDAGRARRALEVCTRGIAFCDSANVPEYGLPIRMRSARVLASLGRLDQALARLDQLRTRLRGFRDEPSLRLEADVLGARVIDRRGEHVSAKRRIEDLFRRYVAELEGDGDISVRSLELESACELRDAVCEIERFTPEQGYRFEMEWVSLGRELLGGRRRLSLGAIAEAKTDREPSRIVPRGVHLAYRFVGERLVRWEVVGGRVSVDTLPVSAKRCLLQVREAMGALQREEPAAGSWLGPRAAEQLSKLSEILLPGSLPIERDAPLAVSITPDGPLHALAFGALPYPPGSGRPLAMSADVAFLMGWGRTPAARAGRPLIVTNPAIPPDLVARYDLNTNLREAAGEASEANARWPDAEVLSGERATKGAIRAGLQGASAFYFASHHVRDLDAPFLGFVPVAGRRGDPPDASMFEIADVRTMDLSSCRLAVLASCSSVAPYRSAVHPGPSLGDAFLDAGASAVVGSLWDVGDAEAQEFMARFLRRWHPGLATAAILGDATREAIASEGATPRLWAAWALQTVTPRAVKPPAIGTAPVASGAIRGRSLQTGGGTRTTR